MLVLMACLLFGFFAVVMAALLSHRVFLQSEGNETMKAISKRIHEGAMVFLHHEYKVMFDFAVVIFIILAFLLSAWVGVAFLAGFLLSVLSNNIGMRISTRSNARTTEACRHSENKGMLTAFHAGSAIGLFVVGIGLVGVALLYYLIPDVTVLYGFGFGASFAALFARVGGGIFTKAADIASDFTGKIERGMPEDDPRNPGTIVDNIGDNVGDVAGMGADLFESYVESIIAAIVIAAVSSGLVGSAVIVEYILLITAAGVFASIFGVSLVRKHLYESLLVASMIMIIASAVITSIYSVDFSLFFCIISGLASGLVIGFSSNYYTSYRYKPTRKIAFSSLVGAGRNITAGLSTGMLSTILPIVSVSVAMLISYYFSGLLGISISAIGMLSILGVVLACDCYGSISDNAAGIAEMAKLPKIVYNRASHLDSIGNTTAAIAKGFAIGSAALTAVALFAAYATATKLVAINIIEPAAVVGLMIGGLLPFVFSAVTIDAVGQTSSKLIDEIRKQFHMHRADSNKAVSMATDAAVRKMIIPSLTAIVVPIGVGLVLGPAALGALLAGSIVTGFLLAITMCNAGGAWDNAKKYIEAGKMRLSGKRYKEVHDASVVGDSVGDPLKDCSGPSLNILIKMMSITALLTAVLLV